MASNWINFVKHYANTHGISYRDALAKAGPAYHKQMGGRNPSPNYRPAVNVKLGGKKKTTKKVKKPTKKMGGDMVPGIPKRYYQMGYELGGVMGGGKSNKGALAALLSGLDARVNIK